MNSVRLYLQFSESIIVISALYGLRIHFLIISYIETVMLWYYCSGVNQMLNHNYIEKNQLLYLLKNKKENCINFRVSPAVDTVFCACFSQLEVHT